MVKGGYTFFLYCFSKTVTLACCIYTFNFFSRKVIIIACIVHKSSQQSCIKTKRESHKFYSTKMAKYIEGVWPNYGLAPLRFKKIGVTLRSQYPNWEIDFDNISLV